MTVEYGSLPFAEALAFFRAKLNLPTEKWDDLMGAAHDRAFVVAGAMQADLLADLKAAVDKAIDEGTTIETFRKDFRQIVAQRGWTGWTGQGTKAGEAWRTRVIYDTNLFASYSSGRLQQMQAVAKSRPYWRYRHSPASTDPRKEHLAWDGLILKHDDPFWAAHTPPNGFGCKCFIETLAERDMKKEGLEITPEGKIPFNGKDPKTGLPQGVGKGWDYQPGANRTTPLYDLIARKLPNLPAPLGAAMWKNLKDAVTMEHQLAWWNTLNEWLKSGKQASRLAVVGAIDPATLAWLDSVKSIQPLTSEIAVPDSLILGPKQRRHASDGNALTEAEWRKLPEMLANPERILFDTRSGKLLYVYPAGGTDKAKLAVEFDYQRSRKQQTTNAVVSAFKTQQADIDGMIKGGIWETVK